MIAPVFTAKISKGCPLVDAEESERYRECMRGLEGQDVEILIRRKTPWCSIRQKKFYHGIVIPMILECLDLEKGEHTVLDIELRNRFLGPDADEHTVSIADLTTVEFEDYMEQIRAAMADEHKIIVPRPNEADIWKGE